MNMMLLLALLAQDRADVPLEADPGPGAKIVLLAGGFSKGGGEHEYFAGSALLAKLLKQTAGVAPVMAAEGWPKDERILDGAKAVVFYMDGQGKQKHLAPERSAKIDALAKQGAGLVYLHQVIDTPKASADVVQSWMGGVWIPGGARGHWDGVFESFPEHPTTRGVAPFTENDGFIYKNRFSEGIVPLLRARPPKGPALKGNEDVVAWAYERPSGGRSFTFTGCHLHGSWGLEGMRRFVVNGILWSAGLEVPKEGAPVALDPADLKKNLDPKPAK